MKLFEIFEKFEQAQSGLDQLEHEYEGKIKGETYRKAKALIIKKLNDYKQQALRYGTNGNICHIQGKRTRKSRQNGKIDIIERFNIYFVAVDEKEASMLLKMHIKNVLQYKVIFIRPGFINITS